MARTGERPRGEPRSRCGQARREVLQPTRPETTPPTGSQARAHLRRRVAVGAGHLFACGGFLGGLGHRSSTPQWWAHGRSATIVVIHLVMVSTRAVVSALVCGQSGPVLSVVVFHDKWHLSFELFGTSHSLLTTRSMPLPARTCQWPVLSPDTRSDLVPFSANKR